MYSEISVLVTTKAASEIIALTKSRGDIKLIQARKTAYNEYNVILGGESSVLSSLSVLDKQKGTVVDPMKPTIEQRSELIRLGVLYKGMNAASATHYLKHFNK